MAYPHAEVLDSLPLAIAVVDRQGLILGVNAEWAEAFGHDRDALHGSSLAETVGLTLDDGGFAGLFEAAPADPVGLRALVHDRDGTPIMQTLWLRPTAADGPILAVFEDMHPGMRNVVRTARSTRHSINNVLMGLVGYAEILRDQPGLDAGARSKVVKIMERVQQIRTEVNRLGALGREAEGDSE
ncbi:hypothetical protein ABI59_13165 [Acidobacteria bacterium Mor1]|nr:hypothetical protein ABI59_13165 [Acidobacteria bacterium Mor1]